MKIDFSQLDGQSVKMSDLQERYSHADLIHATHTMIDTMLDLIKDIPDSYVTFQPEDPDAYDADAATEAEKYMAWTLAHVIVHATASGEEYAANGATLARGVEVNGRNRYEVDWQTVTTTTQLLQRLEESRRMRLAFLNAWPDEPHLTNFWRKREDKWGALNAIGYTMVGLKHDTDHLGQIAEIVRQAKAAEPVMAI